MCRGSALYRFKPPTSSQLATAISLLAGGVEGATAAGAFGLTPLDLAATLGHSNIAQLLREHGAVTSTPTKAAPRRLSMAEAVAEGRVRVMRAEELEDEAEGWDAAFTDSVSSEACGQE